MTINIQTFAFIINLTLLKATEKRSLPIFPCKMQIKLHMIKRNSIQNALLSRNNGSIIYTQRVTHTHSTLTLMLHLALYHRFITHSFICLPQHGIIHGLLY